MVRRQNGAASNRTLIRLILLVIAVSTVRFILDHGRNLGQGPLLQLGIENSSSYSLRESLKLRFENLPLNNDRRIRPFILQNIIPRRRGGLKKQEIVLATHLSTLKFENLLTQLKYWNGPASVAIYISSIEDINRLVDFTEHNEQVLHETSIHLVLERTSELPYPFNMLRKLAMESIESDYFLALDVDFVPFPLNCHDQLLSTLSRISILNKEKTLFILPAFSVFPRKKEQYATADMFPLSKQHVVDLVAKKKMGQFRKSVYKPGHAATQYHIWLRNTNEDGDIYHVSVGLKQAEFFEPYVLGYKPGIPRYWEEFRGFGWDKISFFRECRAAGYRYAVLNEFYCVHLDHPLAERRAEEEIENEPLWTHFLNYTIHPIPIAQMLRFAFKFRNKNHFQLATRTTLELPSRISLKLFGKCWARAATGHG
eukprot:scaffold1525_cov142-Cylindrotheca_fusiformis.AAC.31